MQSQDAPRERRHGARLRRAALHLAERRQH